MNYNNNSNLDLVDVMMLTAHEHINRLAGADQSDPIVVEANAEIAKVRSQLKTRMLIAGPCLEIALLILVSTEIMGILGMILLVLVPFGVYAIYACGLEHESGNICQRAFARIEWRQANDIHAMRMQSDADRFAYGTPYGTPYQSRDVTRSP